MHEACVRGARVIALAMACLASRRAVGGRCTIVRDAPTRRVARSIAPVTAHEAIFARSIAPVTAHEAIIARSIAPVTAQEAIFARSIAPVTAQEAIFTRSIAPVTAQVAIFARSIAPVTAQVAIFTRSIAPATAQVVIFARSIAPVTAPIGIALDPRDWRLRGPRRPAREPTSSPPSLGPLADTQRASGEHGRTLQQAWTPPRGGSPPSSPRGCAGGVRDDRSRQ
jgi:hypothetical protein